ncbi:PTS system, N-acetylglucosamine-specific IIA component [Burkholderia vietnamiensis]|nr:PTS system, N-acetylglucosamine-specific IIA component [Burkholderia vietnamiensis]
MLKRGGNSVQVIIGPEADIIADEMRAVIGSGTAGAAATAPAAAAQSTAQAVTGAAAGPLDPDPLRWLAVFGGATNVAALDAIATTRLRVVVRDASAVDRERLGTLDAAWVSPDTFHIVCGNAAARYAQQLGARLPSTGGGAAAQPA